MGQLTKLEYACRLDKFNINVKFTEAEYCVTVMEETIPAISVERVIL